MSQLEIDPGGKVGDKLSLRLMRTSFRPRSSARDALVVLHIMLFSLIFVYSLLAVAIAAPTSNSKRHVIHERRDRLLTHWRKRATLHGDSHLPMRIALTQSNIEKTDEFLMGVSHPESPNFGKH
jgi:hypothetical protein